MHRVFLLLLLLCSLYPCQAQDSLRFERKVFKTDIYLNRTKLVNSDLTRIYQIDRFALGKQRIGQIMVPTGAIIATAGLYSAVDGLIGVKAVTQIDGKDYEYVVRSLPKLLIGLALFVTGSSVVQGAGDLKIKAARHYNETLRKKADARKTAYQPSLGITPAGNIGFRLEF